MADLSTNSSLRIQDLERQPGNPTAEDPDKLGPIDVTDIEKPEKYDWSPAKFLAWFDRFRDLLANRHATWVKVLHAVEKEGKNKTNNVDIFFSTMAKSISDQKEAYKQQLWAYLHTYNSIQQWSTACSGLADKAVWHHQGSEGCHPPGGLTREGTAKTGTKIAPQTGRASVANEVGSNLVLCSGQGCGQFLVGSEMRPRSGRRHSSQLGC